LITAVKTFINIVVFFFNFKTWINIVVFFLILKHGHV